MTISNEWYYLPLRRCVVRKIDSLTFPDTAVPAKFFRGRIYFRYENMFPLRDGEPRRRVMPLDQPTNKLTPTQQG